MFTLSGQGDVHTGDWSCWQPFATGLWMMLKHQGGQAKRIMSNKVRILMTLWILDQISLEACPTLWPSKVT